MMCMMMCMAGTLFDHNHEQQRNLLHKLFPRVLHDISYILRIPNVASGMVRKPLSSWRGDLHALAGSETASDLEDGFDDSSAQGEEEDGDPMVEGLGGYEGGGAGGEGGYMSADSELAKAVVEVVLEREGARDGDFLEGIEEWLMLCRAMQGMNAHKRIPDGEHIHFEDHSWQYAFQLVRDFIDAQSLIFQGFREKMLMVQSAADADAAAGGERGGGAGGRIAGEPLCQYACRTLWRWCLEVIVEEDIECLEIGRLADGGRVYGMKTIYTPTEGNARGEEEVSFHLPLHRFLVTSWMEILRYHGGEGLEIADEFNSLIVASCGPRVSEGLRAGADGGKVRTWLDAGFSSPRQALLLFILEYPLRIMVALAETQAGLWVRNGVMMPGQIKYYTCPHLCPHTYQLDISALQLGTCALQRDSVSAAGAEQLMGILLDKFRLREWVGCGLGVLDESLYTSDEDRTWITGLGENDRRQVLAGRRAAQGVWCSPRQPVEAEKLVSLLGELLALIIMILCERGLVAPATDEEDVRMHLIQRLASGACTHRYTLSYVTRMLTGLFCSLLGLFCHARTHTHPHTTHMHQCPLSHTHACPHDLAKHEARPGSVGRGAQGQ